MSRKLDLKSYTVSVKNQQGVAQFIPYDFKNVLANIITHPTLGLNGLELLEVKSLVEKIEKSNMEVVLTDEEYNKILWAIKRFKGFSRNDMQFVERIFNCPNIPGDDNKVLDFSNN